ncbi:MAG TPA: 4Fe-4S binding protein [Thermodesulfobacteriota bacterium]|nr:4Fe-4S binding protein [Thermodesulfobacteriota bacterium]
MSGSKDGMSRREFLNGFLAKHNWVLLIDQEKCTGCTLCAIDCPTKALVIHPAGEGASYQLLFRQEACDGCGVCQKSCPEHCLRLIEGESQEDKTQKGTKVVFEDNLSRCLRCGIPLFPKSMVKKLEAQIFVNKGSAWELNLCPSCRIKASFGKEGVTRSKTG